MWENKQVNIDQQSKVLCWQILITIYYQQVQQQNTYNITVESTITITARSGTLGQVIRITVQQTEQPAFQA